VSQSVPRDGGYCNRRLVVVDNYDHMSQSVPRDGGYCNDSIGCPAFTGWIVSIRPEGRGVLQPRLGGREGLGSRSQSVPRDGGYCNLEQRRQPRRRPVSQSVPRDGGYCNGQYRWSSLRREMSQSVPRDGGYCNVMGKKAQAAAERLNPSRGTGGTATSATRSWPCSSPLSQSVPRDGGYCNPPLPGALRRKGFRGPFCKREGGYPPLDDLAAAHND